LLIGTFEWISFRIINKMPKQDIFVGMGGSDYHFITQFSCFDRVIISTLVFFAWKAPNVFVLKNMLMLMA
jgi:SulP family sulfate permease